MLVTKGPFGLVISWGILGRLGGTRGLDCNVLGRDPQDLATGKFELETPPRVFALNLSFYDS